MGELLRDIVRENDDDGVRSDGSIVKVHDARRAELVVDVFEDVIWRNSWSDLGHE